MGGGEDSIKLEGHGWERLRGRIRAGQAQGARLGAGPLQVGQEVRQHLRARGAWCVCLSVCAVRVCVSE